MTERSIVRRELAKQTALLFCVFAVLFAVLGAGVYAMVSANIFRTADENLHAVEGEVGLVAYDDVALGVVTAAPSADALGDSALDGGAGDEVEFSAAVGRAIVDADPQFITLMRDAQGELVDTVGLYATYPAYLAEVPFDARDLDRVYEAAAGGHEYRGITYAVGSQDGAAYAQVLVNVDAELAILDGFTRTLVLYLAAAVVAAAAASYLLSRRTLKPIVESWRAQTEFVQNASHELRTPLAVMQTTGELLLDHPNDRIVDRFEDVSALSSETKRLSRLVDDLMALALDDAGRTTLDRTTVDVDALVRDAASAYEDFASLQGKRLSVDVGFREPLEADADKLRQLVGIVLDNALKYTEPGDEIAVSTRASGTRCVIAVSDTGCGVEPAERERVFDRFYRADKARSRETGGHGLGLALAQGIVEAHGGSITLDANEPHGTVVSIELPR